MDGKIITLNEAIIYIQELENRTRKFEIIHILFDRVRYGELNQFDFTDQVMEILGEREFMY